MATQLFFCEFKSFIALSFDVKDKNLDSLFDIYETYLDSSKSIFCFVNSNYATIKTRLELL